MQITQSDSDPNKVVLTIATSTVTVMDADGKMKTHNFPEKVQLTVCEEITYQELVATLQKLQQEVLTDAINSLGKQNASPVSK